MNVNLKEYLHKNKNDVCVLNAEYKFSEEYENIKAIYYKVGVNKVFAFLGVPNTKMQEGGFPAVVLVHGGDGSAYFEWVKKWTDKGFVAIAPDFNSNYATSNNRREYNCFGGPKGYGSFSQIKDEHPWTFFSVNSIINATSVLANQKEVNAEKISICGISWGGVLSLIALGVEKRIKSAAIIYSSGYLLESEFFDGAVASANMSREDKENYEEIFDPKSYVKEINVPLIFIAGADDSAFTMSGRKKTFDKIKAKKTFSYRKNLSHGHSSGWQCEEAYDFILSQINKQDYPTIRIKKCKNEINIVDFNLYEQVELIYTDKYFEKVKCEWDSINVLSSTIKLPKQCKYFFVSAKDSNKRCFSSDVYDVKKL